MTSKRIWRLIGLSMLLIAVGAGIAFAVWALDSAPPMPEALAAMESDDEVHISTERWLVFTPVGQDPEIGIIIYPGARVDPRAYAPQARAMAAAGYLTVIVPMPLNLALLAPNRARAVMDAFPTIGSWSLVGHSAGGSMAARFVSRYPERVVGLTLWAAYVAGNTDLSGSSLPVASVYGTLDGLVTQDEIEQSLPLLPPSLRLVPIAGGNHAQFGWYGFQKGDNPATISREEQQAIAVQVVIDLLP
jgi:hypothetical protein